MYKFLIADDEDIIRNGLKYIIDWEKFGFKLCGEASNGKEAVTQIIDLQPELVMLDIKMPGKTGIEVVKEINEYFSSKKLNPPYFIILSGYSEFEYAKSALNMGVKFYMLKPIDEDELINNIQLIKEQLIASNNQKEDSKIAAVMGTKDCLIKMFQTEYISIPENLLKSDFFIDYENSNYQAVIFDLSYYPQEFKIELEKTLINYFSFFTKEILNINNSIIAVLKTNNEIAVEHSIERASKLNTKRTYICCGDNKKGLTGLISSYKQALEYKKYLFFISKQNCINSKNILFSENKITKEEISQAVDKILFCIETYDKKQLEMVTDNLNLLLSNPANEEADIKKNLIYCLVELRNKLTSKYPERELSDGETMDVVPKILKMQAYEDVFYYFKNELNNFMENFNFNSTDSVIVKVLAYIKINYTSDLKLETLGEKFNCNSAYLGKKFKKYTGVQFNTYLDDLRIDIAKDKLINTNLKIYQISKLVGYLNTDYFFMKFKKKTGLTPKEFKHKFNKEGDMENDENE